MRTRWVSGVIIKGVQYVDWSSRSELDKLQRSFKYSHELWLSK